MRSQTEKKSCIIYADLEVLIKKIITINMIQKNLQRQKYVNIFRGDINIEKKLSLYLAEDFY